MSSQELTEEQIRVLDKVEKLLRLAARNDSEEEAASASARAQELLEAYNIAVDSVGRDGASAQEMRREKNVRKGGMYVYQRELWRQLAGLNFCLYWTIEHRFPRTIRRRDWWGVMCTETVRGREYRHTVVGRVVNVRTTMMMADYLEGTIERLVKERYPLNSQRFMREAVAYREGIADSLYWRLQERRDKRERDEAERQADAARRSGVSTSQALTIGSVTEAERDANEDFIHGEGWSARQREARAKRAEARRRADEEYTRWAEANPEEARREAEKAEKEALKREKRASRRGDRWTVRDKRQQMGEYWQGRDKGDTVSIEPQTEDRSSRTRRLT